MMENGRTYKLDFESVIMEGVQQRKHLSKDVVKQYAEQMTMGAQFPLPIIVYNPNSELMYLADGYHRVAAMKSLQETEAEFIVYHGTKFDAIIKNLQENASHGLTMTSKEKQSAVWNLLNSEAVIMSDREMGRTCGVDHKTVGKYREMMNNGENPFEKKKEEGAGGEEEGAGGADKPKKPSKEEVLKKEIERLKEQVANLRQENINIRRERSQEVKTGKIDKKKVYKLLHPDLYQAALKDHPELLRKITEACQILVQ